jgi:predicted metal-dependent HD superfamily phosphohydrolase
MMNREELSAAYAAPGRHYHNLAHIEDCLGLLAGVDGLSAHERDILSEAIWWHDVVYVPSRPDNEELSAQLAERHVRADISSEVGRLIRLTKTHDLAADDRLGAILISIDLSILGAEPARYDAYAAAAMPIFAPAAPRCCAGSQPARSSIPTPASPRNTIGAPATISRGNWRR